MSVNLYLGRGRLWQMHAFHTLHLTHSALYTPHALSLHSQTPLPILQSPHHTSDNPLHTLHSTIPTLQCPLPNPYFTPSTLHFKLQTPWFTLHTLHSRLYTPHSALYTPHSTPYTLHSTLDTVHPLIEEEWYRTVLEFARNLPGSWCSPSGSRWWKAWLALHVTYLREKKVHAPLRAWISMISILVGICWYDIPMI